MIEDGATVTYREIESGADPAYADWKRIYLASFPEDERMTLEFFDRMLADKAKGTAAGKHMLAQTHGGGVSGIAYYETDAAVRACFLWYVAIDPARRAHGLGTEFYGEILERAARELAQMLIFEVEIPEDANGEAARRIAWYRRLGARVLTGIHYVQSVDSGVPPVPMHLMVHGLAPLSPTDVFEKARLMFEESLRQTGPLALS